MNLNSGLGRRLTRIPGIKHVLELSYHRQFDRARSHQRIFRGLYRNFPQAMAAIPSGRSVGFDNEVSASRLLAELNTIALSDYPMMFWLSKILCPGVTLFDLGGYVGTSYYSYRSRLAFPESLTWIVCDVPSVVALGRRLAAEQSVEQLRFTTGYDQLERADILIAAGSIHFIEHPFQAFENARTLPPHVLLNKVPVYNKPSMVTLQNMGTAFCPNHLFNRDELINTITDLGYKVVDSWKINDHSCDIPFFPDYSISSYSGFYFTRRTVDGKTRR